MSDPKINAIAIADFYPESVEDPVASREAGIIKCVDIDMIRIRWAGDTKKEIHAPANERSDRCIENPDRSKHWLKWSEAFPEEYKAYKAKEGHRMSGTPLAQLPFLSKARVTEFERQNIFTAEQLQALDLTVMSRLGLDGTGLKRQVEDYLKRAAGVAQDSVLREELAKRDREMEEMRAQIKALMAGASSPITKKPAKAAGDDDYKSLPAFATFDSFDDDALRVWLTDAGKAPHHKLGHESLVKLAVETNDAMKTKVAA